MKTKKAFDCVAMKDDIQRRMLLQWRGMSDSELIARVERDVANLPGALGDFRRRMIEAERTANGTVLRVPA